MGGDQAHILHGAWRSSGGGRGAKQARSSVRPPLRVASMPERMTDQQLFLSGTNDWCVRIVIRIPSMKG